MSKDTQPYEILASRRLAELLGENSGMPRLLSPATEISYHWYRGFEKLEVRDGHGVVFEYQGVFHPKVVCETGTIETGGVCIYCGNTIPD